MKIALYPKGLNLFDTVRQLSIKELVDEREDGFYTGPAGMGNPTFWPKFAWEKSADLGVARFTLDGEGVTLGRDGKARKIGRVNVIYQNCFWDCPRELAQRIAVFYGVKLHFQADPNSGVI